MYLDGDRRMESAMIGRDSHQSATINLFRYRIGYRIRPKIYHRTTVHLAYFCFWLTSFLILVRSSSSSLISASMPNAQISAAASSSSSSEVISIFNYPVEDDINNNQQQHQKPPYPEFHNPNNNIPDAAKSSEEMPVSNHCDKYGITALGMESERIPDSALSASSAFEMLHVGPQNARLNKDKAGGAWCPSKQLGPDTVPGTEWIQVDLGALHVVTGVATQGRYGKGLGQEFTEHYQILYSRQIIPTRWIMWKSLDGRSILEGNIDPNTVEEHHLEHPMVAVRHIRLVPLSQHTIRTMCLRFELFGCLYQGPIAYTIPAIDTGMEHFLLDLFYDGITTSLELPGGGGGNWFGGLGQLTDGIKPRPMTHHHYGSNGPESIWVGWPGRSMNRSTSAKIMLSFEFEELYNFTSVSLNCRNNFTRDIKAFTSALVWFSLDNENWSHSAISFEYRDTDVIQSPKDIMIPLQHRIGQFVRIELTFESKWLHLSEVQFDCHPLPLDLTPDQKSKLFEWTHSAAYNSIGSAAAAAGDGTRYVMPEDNILGNGQNHSSNFGNGPISRGSDGQTLKYSLIIACLCTLGLVIISLLTSLVYKKLNIRKNNVFTEITDHDYESENAAINMKNLPKEDITGSPLYCSPKEVSSDEVQHDYAIPDVICPSNLSKTLHLQKMAPNSMACKTLQINQRFYASSDILHPKQNIYGTRGTIQPQPIMPIRNLLDVANDHFGTGNHHYQNGQIRPMQQQPLLNTFARANMPKNRPTAYGDIIHGTFGVRIYSESEIGVLQTLGKSKYGDVLLCNIPTIATVTGNTQKNRLVVVRTVNDLDLKDQFLESMEYHQKISALHREEFARLLGVIDTPTYFASITEHGDCDLNYFLRKSNSDILSFDVLLYIGSQIANAGVHLETLKHIHQDIATRNVIVYEKSLRVKLTDVAGCLKKYSMDYYNGLPIRWMSPEAIVRSEYTTASDVYGFGVCLWEILNYAKCRPHGELSDEEVLASVYNHMNHGDEMIRLPRPNNHHRQHHHVTNEIYELMEECCDPNQSHRPTFKEISLFLQRKTLAFAKITSGGTTTSKQHPVQATSNSSAASLSPSSSSATSAKLSH